MSSYSIINNVRCKHQNLRKFKTKSYYVCLGCGNNCQFCPDCSKVFTLNTLNKYSGYCGWCKKQHQEVDLEDTEYVPAMEDNRDIDKYQSVFPIGGGSYKQENSSERILPIPFIFPLPSMDFPLQDDYGTEQAAEPYTANTVPTPISEMRMEVESPEESPEEKEADTIMEGTIKNILAKDPLKKLWLIEWENDDHATWEKYDTLKDSTIFKEYIEKQAT